MKIDKSRASKYFQAAMFALSVGLLAYFCISGNNLVILLNSLHSLNLFWLLCAVGCVVLNWMMDGMVIKTLVGHTCGDDYSYHRAFRVTMVGQYFNSITPYSVGGQPMQIVALIRQGISSGIAVSTLVRKFLVYQAAISLFSLFVIIVRFQFFRTQFQGFMALAFIGFLYQAGSVVLLLLFTYSPGITDRLIRFAVWGLTKIHIVKKPEETRAKARKQLEFYLSNNRAMKGDRRLTMRVYGYTLVQLTALFSVPFFIYKAFRSPGAPVFDMIAAQCFVTMISGYTPLPGAAGAAEGSFLVIFKIFFNEKIITQAMLLWRLLAYYSSVVVGAFFAGFDGRREKLKSKSGASRNHTETESRGTWNE